MNTTRVEVTPLNPDLRLIELSEIEVIAGGSDPVAYVVQPRT